jgi:hypothetical protein
MITTPPDHSDRKPPQPVEATPSHPKSSQATTDANQEPPSYSIDASLVDRSAPRSLAEGRIHIFFDYN